MKKINNYLKIFGLFSAVKMTIVPVIVQAAAIGELYHTNAIAAGSYYFYEKALGKNVSYIRKGNEMIGALYDRKNLKTFTCFHGKIQPNKIEVLWWQNLGLIGIKDQTRILRSYTITDYTADNSTPQPGLENPVAVEECTKMFSEKT